MPKSNLTKANDLTAAKYRAPALEKGLDILEMLSRVHNPMTLSQISTRLDRSMNELFRMVQVLEMRGYLASTDSGEGYQLTNKLFSLGMSTGATENLVSTAMPMMQALSHATFQACHLVVASDDQMVVIARMEAPGNLSFSVKVGFRRELVGSTSGTILYAFQRPQVRDAWRDHLCTTVNPEVWQVFEANADMAASHGYMKARSGYTEGITDISCPIFDSTGVVAALTVPHIVTRMSANLDDSLTQLKATTRRLSTALGATATKP